MKETLYFVVLQKMDKKIVHKLICTSFSEAIPKAQRLASQINFDFLCVVQFEPLEVL